MPCTNSVSTTNYCSGALLTELMEGGGIGEKEKENLPCSSLACLQDKISLSACKGNKGLQQRAAFRTEWRAGWV